MKFPIAVAMFLRSLTCLALTTVAVTAAEPWTPAQLTTALWLDAADASTITVDENDRVSQWDDKSGNDRDVTQSRADRRPVYSAAGWSGGFPELQFASYGAQKDTLGRDVSADGISGSAYTLFVVVNAESEDNEEWIHTAYTTQTHPAPGSENRHQINNTGVTVRSDSSNGGTTSGTYVAGEQILQFTLADGASEVLRNGVQIAGDGGTYTPYALSGDYTINGRNSRDGHAGMTGSVVEWIYLTENPSIADRQLVEGYLAWKWGLVDGLPVDHPYKTNGSIFIGTTVPFAITAFDYDPDDDSVTLTWNSNPGEKYAVRFTTDLGGWGSDLEDGVDADAGDLTTETFPLAPSGLTGAQRVYFRIELQPAG